MRQLCARLGPEELYRRRLAWLAANGKRASYDRLVAYLANRHRGFCIMSLCVLDQIQKPRRMKPRVALAESTPPWHNADLAAMAPLPVASGRPACKGTRHVCESVLSITPRPRTGSRVRGHLARLRRLASDCRMKPTRHAVQSSMHCQSVARDLRHLIKAPAPGWSCWTETDTFWPCTRSNC